MKRVIYQVSVNVFLAIRDEMNLAQVMRKTGCVVLTVHRLINKFEEIGLITTKKIGRNRFIYLTKKGRFMQDKLSQIGN